MHQLMMGASPKFLAGQAWLSCINMLHHKNHCTRKCVYTTEAVRPMLQPEHCFLDKPRCETITIFG